MPSLKTTKEEKREKNLRTRIRNHEKKRGGKKKSLFIYGRQGGRKKP